MNGPVHATGRPGEILQPGRGPMPGPHYLPSLPDQVRWGSSRPPAASRRCGSAPARPSPSTRSRTRASSRTRAGPVAYFGAHGCRAAGPHRRDRDRRRVRPDRPRLRRGRSARRDRTDPRRRRRARRRAQGRDALVPAPGPVRGGVQPARQGRAGPAARRLGSGRNHPRRGDAAGRHRRPAHRHPHRLRQRLGVHARSSPIGASRSGRCRRRRADHPVPAQPVHRHNRRRVRRSRQPDRSRPQLDPADPGRRQHRHQRRSPPARRSTCRSSPRARCSTPATRTWRWATARWR